MSISGESMTLTNGSVIDNLINFHSDTESKEFVKELLLRCEQAIGGATDNLKQKRYAAYVTDLSTAVEQFIKIFGLCWGFISLKELRKVGHNPQKVFIRLLNSDLVKLINNLLPEQKNLEKGTADFTELMNNPEKALKTDRDIPVILNYLKNLRKKEEVRYLEACFPHTWIILPYFLAFVVPVHYFPSKYPGCNKELKPSAYNEKLELVKNGKEILNELKKSKNSLKKLLEGSLNVL